MDLRQFPQARRTRTQDIAHRTSTPH
jgi:hypothetical protein